MIVNAHITSGGIVAFLHRDLVAQLSHYTTQIGFPSGESLSLLCSVHSLSPCKSTWYTSWTLALVFWTGARLHGQVGACVIADPIQHVPPPPPGHMLGGSWANVAYTLQILSPLIHMQTLVWKPLHLVLAVLGVNFQ